MRVSAGSLFIALAVFFNSIGAEGSGLDLNIELGSDGEPICAEPDHIQLLTLAELFPGSDGIHLPPLEIFHDPLAFERLYAHIVLSFNGANGPPNPISPNTALARRNRVIIGVMDKRVVRPVTSPNGAPDIVYDTDNKRWVKLKPFEMHRLGLDQVLQHVQSTDSTFGAELPNIDNREYATLAARVEASHERSLYADSIMQAQRTQIAQGIQPVSLLTYEQAYQRGYGQAYLRAYHRFHNARSRFLQRRS